MVLGGLGFRVSWFWVIGCWGSRAGMKEKGDGTDELVATNAFTGLNP